MNRDLAVHKRFAPATVCKDLPNLAGYDTVNVQSWRHVLQVRIRLVMVLSEMGRCRHPGFIRSARICLLLLLISRLSIMDFWRMSGKCI